jgi:CheY-like chemotaxis protein
MVQKPLVLIAEDDQQLREVLELSLGGRYRLVLAEDGFQAVKHVETECPDLIVMDIKMPRLNGWDAIRQIRSRGINTPIIVMTGYTDSWDQKKAQKLGVKYNLLKPFSIIKLNELINKEIHLRRK